MMNQSKKHILLSTYALSKTYRNKGDEALNILQNINLEIKVNHLHAIIGASGSGKSTLLQNLAGLDNCEGKIQFLGLLLHELNSTWQAILRNQCMGFIYQMHHLIPELTALENVMLPYWIAQRQEKNIEKFFKIIEKKLQSIDFMPEQSLIKKDLDTLYYSENLTNLQNSGISESNNFFLNLLAEKQLALNIKTNGGNDIKAISQTQPMIDATPQKYIPHPENALNRAEYLLQRLGLKQRMKHKPSELSGGERQRVAIARAFINRPLCIFADEPTGNLDQFHANEAFDLFKSMVKEENTSLVLVTHDMELAKQCDVIHQLHQGMLN
jgi:ABC-type lipoprotein export system ATPase subunit